MRHLGAGGEVAEPGFSDDIFDSLYCYFFEFGVLPGQVEAGDLKAVEEKTGAAGVNIVGGDALEDLADGELDGAAIFGQGKTEGRAAAAALARVGDGLSGGVVVVTELLGAEAG